MSDYTPTTGHIQDAYCHVQQEVLDEHGDSAHERFHAEFARWLDAHDAEVRANHAVVEVTDDMVERGLKVSREFPMKRGLDNARNVMRAVLEAALEERGKP